MIYLNSDIIRTSNLRVVPAMLSASGYMAHIYKGDASMKSISLSRGKVALVDDADYEWLNQWKWYCSSEGYAERDEGRRGNRKRILMHRLILGVSKEFQADHINNNRLDNRRANLRTCTYSENNQHRGVSSSNTSGYKGVTFVKVTKKWRATIRVNRVKVELGSYKNIIDAARAYNQAAKKYHGEFAVLNDV